ncbi:RNA polymerase sigma factor [Sphaerisporangium rufum]|uniref:RNA polymerase sigma factor n=1 Tax=Sphaerisporangium rufum TaxID=1381558 RepID=UPI001EF250FD|nr:RNA polymerase sigma factor [Sphaerisporangium rufum]
MTAATERGGPREAADDEETMVTQARDPAVGDAYLVRLSQAEPESFGAVFDAYGAEIHRYVAQRLGVDQAEDVVAETFLIAFRKRDGYDPARAGVRAWLYGIATKLVGRHRRSEMRALRALGRCAPERDTDGHDERVATQVSAQSLRPDLARAVGSLNRGDRDVLLLLALGGLSHQEIADALGIPYGTVGSRLNRARRKVRAVLGETDPMDGGSDHE